MEFQLLYTFLMLVCFGSYGDVVSGVEVLCGMMKFACLFYWNERTDLNCFWCKFSFIKALVYGFSKVVMVARD